MRRRKTNRKNALGATDPDSYVMKHPQQQYQDGAPGYSTPPAPYDHTPHHKPGPRPRPYEMTSDHNTQRPELAS